MARVGVDSLDEVRRYYGKPSFAETIALAAHNRDLNIPLGFSCQYRYQMR